MADIEQAGYDRLVRWSAGQDTISPQLAYLGSAVGGPVSLNLGMSGEGANVGASSSSAVSNLITGSVDAGEIREGDLTGSLYLPRNTFIYGGCNGYNDGEGFFLGYRIANSDYGIFIGNSAGNKLTYNTTDDVLTITGALAATSGTIGGWTIGATSLYSGNISLNSAAETILIGSATAPLTGIGVFLGKDGSDYEFRFGDPSTQYIHWDGTRLVIESEIVNSDNVQIVGTDIPLLYWWAGANVTNTMADPPYAVLTNNGQYMLIGVSTATTLYFRNSLRPSVPFPEAVTATRAGLTITPKVFCRVTSLSGNEFIMAFATGGTSAYRYDPDGTDEAACSFSGTAITTGAQRIGFDPTNGYIYIMDGANKASTDVHRYTLTATTLTYVDAITLDTAPDNSGSNVMWLGKNYLVIDDSAGSTYVDIKRYSKAGVLADDTSYLAGTASNCMRSPNLVIHPGTNHCYILGSTEYNSPHNIGTFHFTPWNVDDPV